MSFPNKLERLTKGSTPTLLEATKGNEVIDAINAIANIKIKKGDEDRVDKHKDGIDIFYKGTEATGIEKDIKLIDANNIEQAYQVTIKDGAIDRVSEIDSGFRFRRIAICSNGQTEFVDFLVRE